jgi:hypothetical protein
MLDGSTWSSGFETRPPMLQGRNSHRFCRQYDSELCPLSFVLCSVVYNVSRSKAQRTKYEVQECRMPMELQPMKDEVPGSSPGGPPKIDEGHSSIG